MPHILFIRFSARWAIPIVLSTTFFTLHCSHVEDPVQFQDGGSDGDSDTDADADTDTDGDITHRSGSLIQGVHHTEVAYSTTGAPGVLWLPIPLDYATQVPLYFELIVDPQEAIDELVYEVDELGNTGVEFHFVEDGPFNPVVIHWDAVVLTMEIGDAERPEHYAADLSPDTWLQSTQVVASDYQPIANLGEQILQDSSDALDQMLDIIEWTSSNITYPSTPAEWSGVNGLDATSAYDSGKGSCTSYANLAAALGRAGDIPSRVLANILVGVPQQTHYIDEFYLGEDLGWRRVEPQATMEKVPENFALAMRIIHPDDEGAFAFLQDDFAAAGVPWKSLIAPLENPNRFTLIMETDYFDECSACDNRADVIAGLYGLTEDFDEAFELAGQLWQDDLQSLLNYGHVEEDIQEIRRKSLTAQNLDDVIEILQQREEL